MAAMLKIYLLIVAFLLVVISAIIYMHHKLVLKNRTELKAAEMASIAKSSFLSNMSHEIRTPMNAIIGMVLLAKDVKNNPPETIEYLHKINSASEYLLGLINDILDMSRIENGKLSLQKEPVHMGNLISDINLVVKELALAKKIIYQSHSSECTSSVVLSDKIHLQRVFINIINNAIKFTPPGGTVNFTVNQSTTIFGTYRFVFTISDTGIGMSKSFMEKLFKPFSQENRNESKDEPGTGLGLSICKSIIGLMNGTITVDSVYNQGTTFTIVLELEPYRYSIQSIQDNYHYQVTEYENSDKKLKGKRILLVEDHQINREIAKNMLQKKGLIVDIAENGQQAVQTFEQSTPHFFDAILMDIRMPVMDGLEATRMIKSLDREDIQTLPIIAMTANTFDEDAQKSLLAGMTAHLTKPIQPEILYSTLCKSMISDIL